MNHEVEISWKQDLQFDGLMDGNMFSLDAPPEYHGQSKGLAPKKMLLAALAGCTGMDVAAIMTKSDREPDSLKVKVTAELTDKRPQEYKSAHIVYLFEGKDDFQTFAKLAVSDSLEHYCAVSHMLRKVFPISWEIIYNGKQIFNNSKLE